MGAWKDPPKRKILIAKNGKKATTLICKGMVHKNKMVANAKANNTGTGQGMGTIKISRPEGKYEFKIRASFKAEQKVKGMSNNKPGGIPEDCKIDSAWSFTEIKIFVDSLKMPALHTCEVDVVFSKMQNRGSSKDFDPWAMFNIDIRTGHMVMGSWTNSLHVCDLFAAQQKVVIK